MTARAGRPGMRFSVDAWDPSYGVSLDLDEQLSQTEVRVDASVEVKTSGWRPIDPDPRCELPSTLLFVDGVRRVEARVWVEDETPGADPVGAVSAGWCASYAAGVVCCCGPQAHILPEPEVRRGLFTVVPKASDIATRAGIYRAFVTQVKPDKPLALVLNQAVQQHMSDTEGRVAVEARSRLARHPGHAGLAERDLLVVDGALRNSRYLPRALGYIKSHHIRYLKPEQNALVEALSPGQRTPVFRMLDSWAQHSWYLRLPGPATSPWAGIARIECAADLTLAQVQRLAAQSQACLGRFASEAYKDSRAPQNLYPIAGLERELRRRMGDSRLLYRALRMAAQTGA